jgi:putative RecB family exonuclease
VNPGTLCQWCDFRKVCPAGAAATPKEPWAAVEHLAP